VLSVAEGPKGRRAEGPKGDNTGVNSYEKWLLLCTLIATAQKNMKRKILFVVKLAILVGLIAANDYYPDIIRASQHRKYAGIVIMLLTALLIINLAKTLLLSVYRRRRSVPYYKQDNFTIGVDHIVGVVVFITLLLAVLSMFNVRFKEFFTSISIVAAALALITKDYIANMISGMIITFGNRLSIDDYVRIHEHEGKITDISLTNIYLINDDEDITYIPNNVAFNAEIINYSKGDIRRTSIDFSIDYNHFTSMGELEAQFRALLAPYEEAVQSDSIRLKVYEMLQEQVHMKFQYTLRQPDRKIEREIRRAVRRQMVDVVQNGRLAYNATLFGHDKQQP